TREPGGDSLRLPTWFDLIEAEAELSYSVLYGDDETASFDFTRRLAPSGVAPSDRYELIRSHATLRAHSAGAKPPLEIAMAAPEFALSGRARARFLELVAPSARDIAAVFAKARGLREGGTEFRAEQQNYLTFLADREAQREVVVFLSYKGKTP